MKANQCKFCGDYIDGVEVCDDCYDSYKREDGIRFYDKESHEDE